MISQATACETLSTRRQVQQLDRRVERAAEDTTRVQLGEQLLQLPRLGVRAPARVTNARFAERG